jgi:hypothetical protein
MLCTQEAYEISKELWTGRHDEKKKCFQITMDFLIMTGCADSITKRYITIINRHKVFSTLNRGPKI